jgi:hypothetical protein
MIKEAPPKSSTATKRNSYYCIVMGILCLFLVPAFNKAGSKGLVGDGKPEVFRVLTKARPVVGEWIEIAPPTLLEMRNAATVALMTGVLCIFAGLAGLESSKHIRQIEKLTARIDQMTGNIPPAPTAA